MTTKTEKPKKNTPDFYVHAIVPTGRNSTRVGSRLGAIFNHNNGDGFAILLDAIPIPLEGTGQIQLVAYKPQP